MVLHRVDPKDRVRFRLHGVEVHGKNNVSQLDLINAESLLINLKVAPAVVIGVFGGRWLVHKVPQKHFEWMVVIFSIVAGIRLMLF